MEAFWTGFEKVAIFGFGKKQPKTYTITKEHEKVLMPSFKRHDALRKAGDHTHDDNWKFVDAVSQLEAKTGIPNEQLYAHMYKHHGFDRHEKTASFWLGFSKLAGFIHGGYALNLVRQSKALAKAAPSANKVVSRAAQAATTAAKSTPGTLGGGYAARKAMTGSAQEALKNVPVRPFKYIES